MTFKKLVPVLLPIKHTIESAVFQKAKKEEGQIRRAPAYSGKN
jgi:hypothetical protein